MLSAATCYDGVGAAQLGDWLRLSGAERSPYVQIFNHQLLQLVSERSFRVYMAGDVPGDQEVWGDVQEEQKRDLFTAFTF